MIVNSECADVVAAVKRVYNHCVRVKDGRRLDGSAPSDRKRNRKCRITNGHRLHEQQHISQHKVLVKVAPLGSNAVNVLDYVKMYLILKMYLYR